MRELPLLGWSARLLMKGQLSHELLMIEWQFESKPSQALPVHLFILNEWNLQKQTLLVKVN